LRRNRPAIIIFILLSLAVLLFTACEEEDDSDGVIAIVGGKELVEEDAWKLMGADPGSPIPVSVVEQLIRRELVLSEALDLGVTVAESRIDEVYRNLAAHDEVILAGGTASKIRETELREQVSNDLLYEAIVEQEVIARITVAEAEIATFYAEQKEELTRAPLRFSQIVLPDMEAAEATLARLDDGEDFPDLAIELSLTPEGARGGLVELDTAESLPDAIADALTELGVGEMSEPIETDYGVHLLILEESSEEPFTPPLELVRDELRQQMIDERSAEELENWLLSLEAKAADSIWRAELEELPQTEEE